MPEPTTKARRVVVSLPGFPPEEFLDYNIAFEKEKGMIHLFQNGELMVTLPSAFSIVWWR
jgi:hypothetical protein